MLVPLALARLFVAATCLDNPMWLPARVMSMARPVRAVDRVMAGILPSAFFLVHSAAVTSFGLALATLLSRTGLAVAVSVSAFVVMTIDWIVAVESVVRPLLNSRLWQRGWQNNDEINALILALIALSPVGGQAAPLGTLLYGWNREREPRWKFMPLEVAVVATVAIVFLGLTLLTFNRL
jgi:hypothetical protein